MPQFLIESAVLAAVGGVIGIIAALCHRLLREECSSLSLHTTD